MTRRFNFQAYIPAILLMFSVSHLFAQTTLNGQLQKYTLDSLGNPYMVNADIIVPAGKKLVIKEGCLFFFKEFTGVHISGAIAVNGTASHPVVFTSINDGAYNKKSEQAANPFDWNGILIDKETSEAAFKNFCLNFSVYGIKAQTPAITIKNGLFKQNGQFHFTINDKIQLVQDNIPYSFGVNEIADNGGPSVKVISDSEKSKGPRASTARLVVRYTGLGVGVVGAVAGTLFLLQYQDYQKKIDDLQSKPNSGTGDLYTNYDNKRVQNGTLTGIFYGLAGAGLLGFGFTFLF